MINIELREYIKCTKEEKKPVLKAIDEIIYLAVLARREGVLALEQRIEELDDRLLKTGLGLIVDGTDPALVKDILETTIVTSFKTGAELLSQLIITEGLLSLQAGENPRIIEEKLLAFLGGEYTSQDLSPTHLEIDYKYLMSDSSIWTSQEGLPDFENLLNLSNRDIQIILREIDCKDLSVALKGASNELKHHFLNNMSMRASVNILFGMKYTEQPGKPELPPQPAQQKILDTVKRLKEAGEVIIQ